MAHFSRIENGIVTQVIVVSNDNAPGEFPESEAPGVAFCKMLFGEDTEWKQTSYNNNFRVHYAGIGYSYDEDRDAFIPPSPGEEWTLNEEFLVWENLNEEEQ